jgi:hypothetical protein
MEDELNAYIEEHSQFIEDDGEEAEDLVQPSNTKEFPYQQPYYDYGPSSSSSSSSSSSREPDYDHANDYPPI